MEQEDRYTDITFELFNYCNGSCTGCMLSQKDREVELSQSIENIKATLFKLNDYGLKNNIYYRPVFSFGDTFKYEEKSLFSLFDYCIELKMSFGATVTCVDDKFSENYLLIAKKINEQYSNNVIDITIDPFRLKSPFYKENYIKNLRNVINNSKKLHLQVLLSDAVLNKFTPKELYDLLKEISTDHPFFLAFSPTLENLEKNQYKYNIVNAYQYAKDFYQINDLLLNFYNNEMNRFKNTGKYSDFAKIVFHISNNFDLYPVNYSIFGDIIRDERNKNKKLGNLLINSFEEILSKKELIKLDIKNEMEMDGGVFDCNNCEWLESCTYSGIGLIRSIYKEYEFRVGHCYGPKI